MGEKVIKTDEEWQKQLSKEEYSVTREKGTEPPFSGEYYMFFEEGLYKCVCCENILFSSKAKYYCSCGWPSFYEAYGANGVAYKEDHSHGKMRTEVLCKKCGAHLGHVFDDGPEPTGKRYCVNSVAIKFNTSLD